jgi:hypothetical protein
MQINPDFRACLQEVRREGKRRIFRRVPAGAYRISIQASGEHHCAPQRLVAVEDYDRWEVALFAADGSWVTPQTHPELFSSSPWVQYWVPSNTGETASGQYVPTEVVQTFFDFLVLGPARYEAASRTEP